MSTLTPAELQTCTDLLAFIDASPTPFHAVSTAIAVLEASGFEALSLTQPWPRLHGGRYYVAVGDGTLIAFAIPSGMGERGLRGFRIIGAHTDSPNLRLKPKPLIERAGYAQLGVEVYGSPLLNSWLDRDLYLAGRVVVRDDAGQLVRRLVRLPEPLLRVTQLAIHLDRDVNEKGLVLNRQEHLAPILGLATEQTSPGQDLLRKLCAEALGIAHESIVTTELMLADSLPGARGGLGGELIYSARLDNLGMSHASLHALLRAAPLVDAQQGIIPLIALFDHEEVGSETAYGAHSPSLPGVLERISLGLELSRGDYLRALAGSLCVSADMAHAVHPNFADRHEPQHRPLLNHGPIIKSNSQQRYATCGRTAALFTELCRQAEVPVQHYIARTDMPCGSTIGPITATLLGIPTVDVGNPMLSMHSAREMTGAKDPERMATVLTRFLNCPETV
jgi:aspartyl aminopeptidase